MKIYITKWWKTKGIVCAEAHRYEKYLCVDWPEFFGTEGNDCEFSPDKARASVRMKAEKRARALRKQADAVEQLLADASWPPVPES